ncbi:hypothetical protein TSMG0122 [Halocynthia phage JM-2012]|uniref:hypothetical protein n=1 Tax=Halocynthia phage JM-2012 TaxID=1173297 RepID=UPI00025C6956|nr:hypothetical protein TSMG0122 [Halocynthia phage JM-2012]AFI55405.1 hypothetical protein TSMG0122 [Halocynthia phage JM-2012]
MDLVNTVVEFILWVVVSACTLLIESVYYILTGLSWITNKLYLLEITLFAIFLYILDLSFSMNIL